jgi:hypothetical protein
MEGDSVVVLLQRVATQHEREVTEACEALRAENERLTREMVELRSKLDSPALCSAANAENNCNDAVPMPGVPEHMCPRSNEQAPECGARKAGVSIGFADHVKEEHGNEKEAPDAVVVSERSERSYVIKKTMSRKDMEDTNADTHLENAVATLDANRLAKQRRRIRRALQLKPNSTCLTAQELLTGLMNLSKYEHTLEQIQAMFTTMQRVGDSIEMECDNDDEHDDGELPLGMATEFAEGKSIELRLFVGLIMHPALVQYVEPEMAKYVGSIQRILNNDADLDDMLIASCELTNGLQSEQAGAPNPNFSSTIDILNFVVAFCVLLSLVFLGVSISHSPSSPVWTAVDAVFAAVFIFEVCFKWRVLGVRGYFCSDESMWNCMDFAVTLTAAVDLVISIINSSVSGALKLSFMLRVLRLARLVRLVRLLQDGRIGYIGKFFRELADMLTGFVIGMPALFWVMVLLFSIFFAIAVIFMSVVGPAEGQNLTALCGSADDLDFGGRADECIIHYLYGEEYFGTVSKSIFTIFRCMIGDCATRKGQSLIVHFSLGYGLRFEICYFVGMIIIVFGVFNIITAIFVETTVSGLRHNELQKRRHRFYEGQYVETKVVELADRITTLHKERAGACSRESRRPSLGSDMDPADEHDSLKLSEEEFHAILKDEQVQIILWDLDVNMVDQGSLFEMFDTDGDGSVRIGKFISTIIRTRGQPQKADTIANWLAIRALNTKFQEFELVSLKNQRRLLECVSSLAGAPSYRVERPNGPYTTNQ